MNVRFAEPCREKQLDFVGAEWDVFASSVRDGRNQEQLQLKCEKDIFIGVFFDGTNNNKYRDTPNFSHSNVARLYEAYPGTPAAQKDPTFAPRVKPDGSSEARPVFPDKAFKASSVPPEDYPYYRKIYVPGLGTALPDVGDSGTGMQKKGGLATALLGQVRLDWAMLQLVNQVHAAVFNTPLETSIDLSKLLSERGKPKGAVPHLPSVLGLGRAAMAALQDQIQDKWNQYEKLTGTYDNQAFNALLAEYEQRLAAALTKRGNNKPHIRKIRLSVFGFSRGAAAARAWVNMVTNYWGSAVKGIPLQIDFLGIFDTVASVGLAQATPHFNGHAAWADDAFMPVPATVKRCAHLVAGLEVRGSFPLDSVCQNNVLPPHCKEVVYPGVHSDVGGGYPPDDQGRALGQGAEGDKLKPSQISLAQMYREARMAGVPLAPESAMDADKSRNFAIAPKLREDFNAYVAATRSGSVPPTQGTGNARFASMFPTETQPREELYRIVRRHAGYLLRWRKSVMNGPGMAGLPGLKATRSGSKHQDVEDFRGAEEELRKEISFLQSNDPKKFDTLDDPFFESALAKAKQVGSALPALPVIGQILGPVTLVASWGVKGSLSDLMRDKQRQWDTWLHEEWARHQPDALPDAAKQFFEHYVHDSRAWFKPFMRSDGRGMVPDDETWFVFGGREKERNTRTAQLNQDIAKHTASGDKKALANSQQELRLLQQDGQPLMVGGREPYRMWGYVRHRRLYQTGKLIEASLARDQQTIEREEKARSDKTRRERLIAEENARHEAALARIRNDSHAVISRPQKPANATGPGPWRLPQAQEDEYLRGAQLQKAQEDTYHAEQLQRIERDTLTATQ